MFAGPPKEFSMIARHSIAVLAAMIVGGLACGSSDSVSYGGGGGPGTPPTGDVLIVSGAQLLAAQAFNPNPFTTALNGGASVDVIFANQDNNVTHSVTQDGASPTFSHDFPGYSTFTITFNTAGTYTYHCRFHPTMVGSITVNP
jgi:hypothetical protein